MIPTRVAISPAPGPEEAAAITSAVLLLLESGRRAPADPRPAAYRSAWRGAAIREGVGLPIHDRRTR